MALWPDYAGELAKKGWLYVIGHPGGPPHESDIVKVTTPIWLGRLAAALVKKVPFAESLVESAGVINEPDTGEDSSGSSGAACEKHAG